MWKHWAIHACTPLKPFEKFENARWAWFKLSELFPNRIAMVLMPGYFHLILPAQEAQNLNQISGLLGAISKRLKKKNLWQPLLPASEISDTSQLLHQCRYLARSPCRAGLTQDPLEWYWSTYREVMGATVERKNTASLWTQIFQEPLWIFQKRFHTFVSKNPSFHFQASPFPKRAPHPLWAMYSILEILEASAAALLRSPSEVQRRGALRPFFVHFASRHGWHKPALLSQICGTTPRAISFLLKKPTPEGMEAADLCLGDIRLRRVKASVDPKGRLSHSDELKQKRVA